MFQETSEKYGPLGPHGTKIIPGKPNPFSLSPSNALGVIFPL